MRSTLGSVQRRHLILALVLTIPLVCRAALAQPQILRWDIEATVVEVGDPDKIFTTVRLGDPVKGFLSYDAAAVPAEPDPNDVLYEFQPFVVAGMTIENPRDNSRIELEPDREILAFVEIFNDVNNPMVGKFDGVSALQSMVSPKGFTGFATSVGVDLYGPPSVLSSTNLPTTLKLDDWPEATIAFYDAFGGPSSYLVAEIHTLTPVTPPTVPGDFNGNGYVDTADYVAWRDRLGSTYAQTDYDVWRANFGQAAAIATTVPGSAGGSNAAVPEASTLVLVGLILVSFTQRISGRCNRGSLSRLLAVAVAVTLNGPSGAHAQRPFFMGLGVLPGYAHSTVDDISYDGSVAAGGSHVVSGEREVYRWTRDSGMVGLGLPDHQIQRVSADGSTILATWEHLWTSKGLLTPPIGDGFLTGVSGDGSVVCGYNSGMRSAVRWTEADGVEYLPRPVGVFEALATDISADGSSILAIAIDANSRPQSLFLWSGAEGLLTLNLPSPFNGGREFVNLSDNGMVVTANMGADADRRGFRWTKDAGAVELGRLPDGRWMTATGVSADGSIVVGNSQGVSQADRRPAIWDSVHGPRYLDDLLMNELALGTDLAGWTLFRAEGVSGDGRTVIGEGMSPDGNSEAWIAYLGPAPRVVGDFNNDGTVDAADYAAWRNGLGTTYIQADYDVWRANFDTTAAAAAAVDERHVNGAIPEPSALLLVASAVAGVTWTLHGRRRRGLRPAARPTVAALALCVLVPSSARATLYTYLNVADTTTTAPSGLFTFFSVPSISGNRAAFRGDYSGGGSIFTGSGGALTTIATSGDPAPSGGTFTTFRPPAVDSGTVAFQGFYTNGSGISTGSGGALTTIAKSGDPAPPGGMFMDFGTAAIDGGTVAFVGDYTGGGGRGIFTGSGGVLTTIAKSGDPAPPGGTFTSFDHSAVDSGTVAFRGDYNAGVGIFMGSGGALTTIAKSGDPAPPGGTFSGLTSAEIDGGTVAFLGLYAGGHGIFTGSGGTLDTVIKTGDSLFGSTVTGLGFDRFGLDRDGSGNLAFGYTLADGRSGVAIASVPEARAWLMLGVLFIAALISGPLRKYIRGLFRRNSPDFG
jgi:uncharacterized membrane protein